MFRRYTQVVLLACAVAFVIWQLIEVLWLAAAEDEENGDDGA